MQQTVESFGVDFQSSKDVNDSASLQYLEYVRYLDISTVQVDIERMLRVNDA